MGLINMKKWDLRFLSLTREISLWSKDPSTKVGALIVDEDRRIISQGYNGFPRGIEDDGRLNDRNEKYPRIVHAELNAIFNAARNGVSVNGCTIYVYGLPICNECAKAIVQSGISRVIIYQNYVPTKWEESWNISKNMFEEAGIDILMYDE